MAHDPSSCNWWWLVCIGISALTYLAGCSKTVDPQQFLAEGKQLREAGDNRSATIQLRNALQKEPGLAEARYLLGTIYSEADYPVAAEKELRLALEAGFDSVKVLPSIAWSLLMQGQYQKLLDEIELDWNSAAIITLRGYAELALGRPPDAASSFEAALKLDPRYDRAILGQAQLALAEGKKDDAHKIVNQVLAATPRNVEAWLLSADLHSLQGNDDQASAAYTQVLQVQPDNVSAYMRRSWLLANAGKFEAAQEDVNAVRRVTPGNPLATYAQAVLFFHWGKPGPALEAVQQVLRIAPDHLPSVMLAALLYFQMDAPQLAQGQIKQFLDRNPNNVYARKLLVAILLKQNESDRAVQALDPALKLAPRDAQLLALAGEAYMQTRQFDKATEYLQQASALLPDNADVRTRLGVSRLALGETARATAELESAVNLDRALSRADTLLVMTYLRQKKFDRALETSLKLQKKHPDNPVIANLLGGAYLGKNDLANARKSFGRALSLQPDYLPAAMLLSRLDLRANDADGARNRFKAILATNPRNIGAIIGLASIDRATGNVKGYAALLESARTEDSKALAPRLLLVRHYLLTGNPTRALDIATEASTIEPKHPDVLNALGEAHSANGNKVNAAGTYAELANVIPLSPLAQYRLALAHIAREDYRAAADPLKRALRLKPDYLDAEVALALLEYRAGRYDDSLRLAQQIQRQYPKLPIGFTLEGDGWMEQQKFAAAETAYEKAFARRKSDVLAMKLHAASSQAGRAKETDEKILRWLREHPADTAVRLYLADAYVKGRQYPSAIGLYQHVLQQDAKNFLALNNLATLYRKQDDPRALEYLEQSYKLKPDSAAIAGNLGWVLVESGQVERGVELLSKAAVQAPNNPEIGYHLAAALAKSGKKAQARRELERLLGTNKEFHQRAAAQALLRQL